MASDALSPHVVSETANPIILRNRLAFEETKKAMQNDVPFPFVNALDRMCQFIEKDDAYYPEALPEYIDILEIGVDRLKVWLSMPIDRGVSLDESLRTFRTFTFELVKRERKFGRYPALLARLKAAFSWIFQPCQSPIDLNAPIVPAPGTPLNQIQNPPMTSYAGGTISRHSPSMSPAPLSLPTPTSIMPQEKQEQFSLAQSHQARMPDQNSSFGPTALSSSFGLNAGPSDPRQPLNPTTAQVAPSSHIAELESLVVHRRTGSSHMPLRRSGSFPVSPISPAPAPNYEATPHNNSPSFQSSITLSPLSQSGLPNIRPSSSSSASVLGPGRVHHLGASPAATSLPFRAAGLNRENLQEQGGHNAIPSTLSLRSLTAEARSNSPAFGSLKPVHPNNIGTIETSGGPNAFLLTPPVKVEQVSMGMGGNEDQNASGPGLSRVSNHMPPTPDLPSKESPAVIVKSETAATSRPEAPIFDLPRSSTAIAPTSQQAAPSHSINTTSITDVGAPRAQSSFAPETPGARSGLEKVTDRAMSAPGSMQTASGIDGARAAAMDTGMSTGHVAVVGGSDQTSAVDTAAGNAITGTTMVSRKDLHLSHISSTQNVNSTAHPHENSLEDGEVLEVTSVASHPEGGDLINEEISPVAEAPRQSDKERNMSRNPMPVRAAGRDPHSGRIFPLVQAPSSRATSTLPSSMTQLPTDSRPQMNQSSLTMEISDEEVDQLLQDRGSISSGLEAGARELEATQLMLDGVEASDSAAIGQPNPTEHLNQTGHLNESATNSPPRNPQAQTTEWVVSYQVPAGQLRQGEPNATIMPSDAGAVSKIREILTPVIVGHVQREHPDADPASITAKISDEHLLELASYAGPFFSEAQQAGVDLREWRLRQSTPASAISAPPTAALQALNSPAVPKEIDTPMPGPSVVNASRGAMASGAPGAGVQADTASLASEEPTTHPAQGRGGAHYNPIGEDSHITAPENSAMPNQPATKRRQAAQLHKVYRTLCTLIGSDTLSTVTLPFELATTEVTSIMRWAQRHQEIDSELEYLCLMLRCLPKDLAPQVDGEDVYGDCWPTYGNHLFLHHQIPEPTPDPLYLPLAPPILSAVNEPVCLSALINPGINKFQLVQITDCSNLVFALQLCKPAPAEFEKWLKHANDKSIRENAWRTLLERAPTQPTSPFQLLVQP